MIVFLSGCRLVDFGVYDVSRLCVCYFGFGYVVKGRGWCHLCSMLVRGVGDGYVL